MERVKQPSWNCCPFWRRRHDLVPELLRSLDRHSIPAAKRAGLLHARRVRPVRWRERPGSFQDQGSGRYSGGEVVLAVHDRQATGRSSSQPPK
jgi:hypothetical protein